MVRVWSDFASQYRYARVATGDAAAIHVSVADAICEVILGSQGTADQAKRLARVCDPHSVPVVAVRWIDRQPFIEPAPGLGKPRVISLNGIRWRVADPS